MMINNEKKEKIALIKNFNFFKKQSKIQTNGIVSILRWGKYQDYKPFLSIIIPTYKRTNLLKQTLNSIIKQNVLWHYEIIICDNEGLNENVGVTETEKMIRDLSYSKIMYYRNSVNDPSNWNICVNKARGEWICMVHDDDILFETHLNTMHNIVSKNPEIKCLGCKYKSFKDQKEIEPDQIKLKRKKAVKYVYYDEFMYGMPVSLLGAFFKRDLAIELGAFDLISYIGDYVFMAKYAYYFGVYLYSEKLYGYRVSQSQDSANNEMNSIRRISDYYLWRSIADKRNAILKPYFLLRCEYNLIERIKEYNKDKTTYGMREIDIDEICEICEIEQKKINNLRKYIFKICRGIFVAFRICIFKISKRHKIRF